MILSNIRELCLLSKVQKLEQTQREKVYGLMRSLREYGFTNHELFVIFRGKVAEASIKRNTRGVKVKDTAEHDRVLEELAVFADQGYEFSDIGDYRKDRKIVDEAGLNFESCARLSKNLLLLGLDAMGLVKLSDELTSEGLTAKSIRGNIDLNEKLAKKNITVEIQEEIHEAAERYGDPVNILGLVNAVGGIKQAAVEKNKIDKELAQAKTEKEQVQREKERLEIENANFRSYVDVAKLLVAKYGFDLTSLNELLSLAGKHGSAVHTIGAVNIYNGIVELQGAHREAQAKLHTTEIELADKKAMLKVKEEGLARANQLLGEIKASQAQSLRLQIVSDLIMKPKETKATIDELARICLIVLMGIKEYTENNKQESERFRNKVGTRLNWAIQDLQEYLR